MLFVTYALRAKPTKVFNVEFLTGFPITCHRQFVIVRYKKNAADIM